MVDTETTSRVPLPPAGMGGVTATRVGGTGTWVIALTGEHDRSTTPDLDRRTHRVWRRCDLVIVDLGAATFVDSSLVEWLLRTGRALDSTGHDGLRVVTGPPGTPASRLIGLFSPVLRDRLGCHPTVESALRAQRSVEAAARAAHGTAWAEPAATVFDRVEARAWVLAVWIVRDVQLADELVVAAFAGARTASATTSDDDLLVWDVRRLALAAAPAPRAGGGTAEAVREAILGLPEAQREAVELSLFGGLSIDGLAAVTRTPRAAVVDHLVAAMRVLRPVLGRRARDGGALASALPVPPTRLAPPERWVARGRARAQRSGAGRRVAVER